MPVLPQRTALHVLGRAAKAGEGKGRIYRADAGLVASQPCHKSCGFQVSSCGEIPPFRLATRNPNTKFLPSFRASQPAGYYEALDVSEASGGSSFFSNMKWMMRKVTPTVMAESATLKAGQW